MCDLTNYKIFYCNPIALYSAHNFSSSISYTRHIILIGNTVFRLVHVKCECVTKNLFNCRKTTYS